MTSLRAHLTGLVLITLLLAACWAHGQGAPARGAQTALSYSHYVLNPLDRVNSAAAGADGTLYLAGVSLMKNTPIDPSQLSAGEGNAFVARLSGDGSKLFYLVYLDKSGLSEARAVAVDGAGNVYVTGATRAENFPVVHALRSECSRNGSGECGQDAFVAKLDRKGIIVFATRLGATGDTTGNAIAVDSKGNILVGGSTNAYDFATSTAAQTAPGGGSDAFVALLAGDGSALRFVSYLGGSGDEEIRGLAVASDDSAVVTGATSSADFPTRNALQSQCRTAGNQACNQAFVAKLSPDGTHFDYSTYLGGSARNSGNAVAIDAEGFAYVAGTTSSTDFPVTNSLQSAAGSNDAFVVKIAPDGSALGFATLLGGRGSDRANSIAVDSSGKVHVAGSTQSLDFPTRSAFQTGCGKRNDGSCSVDGFVATLDSQGKQLHFSSYLGGHNSDLIRAIAVDSQGSAYVAGWTSSPDFPLSGSATRARAKVTGGNAGSFVAKITGAGQAIPQVTCGGGTNNWTGTAGDNQWTTANNWSTGAVPVSSDNVCIDSSFTHAINVGSLGAANQTIASLNAGAPLTFATGPLTISGTATFAATLTVSGGIWILNGTTSMATVSMVGGILAGSGTNTISGQLTWSGGSMCTTVSGTSCTTPGSNATTVTNGITLNSAPTLNGRTLNTSGTSGSTAFFEMLMYNGAVVNNQAGATWSAGSDFDILAEGGTGNTFNNAGIFQKTGGTSTSQVTVIFNNNTGSSVSGGAGTVQFSGGGSGAGKWAVSSNATVLFAGSGTFTLTGAFSGAGRFTFQSGTTTLAGASHSYNVTGATTVSGGTVTFSKGVVKGVGNPLTISGGVADFQSNTVKAKSMTMSGGIYVGSGTLTITGVLTWSGGSMCTTQSSGVCTAPSSNAVTNAKKGIVLSSSPALNGRTLNASKASSATTFVELLLYNGAVVNVLTKATWTFGSDFDILNEGGTGTNTFNNAGAIKKTGGTSTSQVNVVFNNNTGGTVSVGSGTVDFGGGGTGPGNWSVSNGTLAFTGGTFTLSGGISGAGTVTFQAGTVTLSGAANSYAVTGITNFSSSIVTFSNGVTLAATNLIGGILASPSAITISGLLTWSGGSMCTSVSGSSCTPPGTNAVTTTNGGITLSGAPTLNGRTLNTAGTAASTAFFELLMYNGAVVNNQAGATWSVGSDFDILNEGGTGTNTFNNAGTFQKTGGTSTSQVSTVFNNSSSVSAGSGTFSFTGAYTQTAGGISLSGGSLSFNSGAVVNGGSFTGTGSVTGAISNTAGGLAPGTNTVPGTITLTGTNTYSQGSSGSFNVKVGGTGAGQFDTAAVGGAATLGGALNLTLINGFTPQPNTKFTVMTFASKSGQFASVTSGWSVSYTSTSAVATYTGARR